MTEPLCNEPVTVGIADLGELALFGCTRAGLQSVQEGFDGGVFHAFDEKMPAINVLPGFFQRYRLQVRRVLEVGDAASHASLAEIQSLISGVGCEADRWIGVYEELGPDF